MARPAWRPCARTRAASPAGSLTVNIDGQADTVNNRIAEALDSDGSAA